MTDSIAQRITQIRQTLPEKVRLIAVTKKISVSAMREAYQAGIRDFGESRIQEALPKQEQLQDLDDIRWHFIGHLQRNKVKKALDNFQWIHSCASLNLAQRIDRLALELSCHPSICLQVKILPDPHKQGWEPLELMDALPQLNQLQQIKIQGLMTILPQGLSSSEVLEAFQGTQKLAQRIADANYPNLPMGELSMGMSGDYDLAIQGGTTMIRLGRIIFGERQ